MKGGSGDNDRDEDSSIGGGGINDGGGMDSVEAGPSTFEGHVKVGLSNEVRNNRNTLHVNGDDAGPTPIPRRMSINHCRRAEMSDRNSEDFLKVESSLKSDGDNPN